MAEVAKDKDVIVIIHSDRVDVGYEALEGVQIKKPSRYHIQSGVSAEGVVNLIIIAGMVLPVATVAVT